MSYARARLYLGITAVGTTVTVAIVAMLLELPRTWLPTNEIGRASDILWLTGFVVGLTVFLLPFDLLGGYILPRRHGRVHPPLDRFVRQWLIGVFIQSTFFVIAGLVIISSARFGGMTAANCALAGMAIGSIAAQGWISQILNRHAATASQSAIEPAMRQCTRWGLPRVNAVVVEHGDPGFTGGVVGLPGREQIIVPASWTKLLSAEQLAAVLARRVEAVASGSRSRGLAMALLWTVSGFVISCAVCGAAPRSVGLLVSVCLAFTCWTFLGLLVLPSISRQAAYALDQQIMKRGVSAENLQDALQVIDREQDDEPERSPLIETIFHPVPALNNREKGTNSTTAAAWHTARTALFVSWSCLGPLSRSVHCNAGRPELWALLPTD